MPRYQDSDLHDSSEHSSEEIPAKKKKVITKKRVSFEKQESKSNSRTNQKSKSKSDKFLRKIVVMTEAQVIRKKLLQQVID